MALRALLAIAILVAVAAPVGHSARDAAPSTSVLLARHVPVVVLHPAERFAPVAVDGFLADSDLQRKAAAVWEPVPGPLPVGGVDHRLDQRVCSAREGVAASPCYAQAQAAHGSAPVVYGAAFRSGSRIDLQYWLWYPYNDYSPTVPAGDLWQVHEGDWEAVSVIVDLSGKPLHAAYSQHSKGERRAWATVRKQGVRPVVYVGRRLAREFLPAGCAPPRPADGRPDPDPHHRVARGYRPSTTPPGVGRCGHG